MTEGLTIFYFLSNGFMCYREEKVSRKSPCLASNMARYVPVGHAAIFEARQGDFLLTFSSR